MGEKSSHKDLHHSSCIFQVFTIVLVEFHGFSYLYDLASRLIISLLERVGEQPESGARTHGPLLTGVRGSRISLCI